jgi:divalent metal cation (Fe/Co/Zn/Cd) transporter
MNEKRKGMELLINIFGSKKIVHVIIFMSFLFIVLSGIRPFISNPDMNGFIAFISLLISLGVTIFSFYKFIRYLLKKINKC